MLKNYLFIVALLSLTACSHTYYVVRHAEKQVLTDADMMKNDPPLTDSGKERAVALGEVLKGKHIRYIFSTNTLRTRSTSAPLSASIAVPLTLYGPKPDPAFIQKLKSLKGNVLVVAHSNTVAGIVNGLCNKTVLAEDLKDNAYDNLFVISYHHFLGHRISFRRRKYGR